jgi:hypothetical protein
MSHYRTLFDAGKYLASWHLPRDKDVTVTIEAVTGGELKNLATKKVSRKPLIKFQGKALLFACNVTNGKVIEKLYGPMTKDWVGKPLTLHVGRVRSPEGGMCDGICVRPKVGESAGQIDEAAKEVIESE